LQQTSQQGFANYFGAQRVGRNQDNVEQAIKILSDSRHARRLKRQRKSLMISSLRSFLFNQILERRIASGVWEQPVDGDVFQLAGSHSVFSEALDETLISRYHQFDLHCALPLYGQRGSISADNQAKAIEDRVFNEYAEICQLLEHLAVKLSYRSNRAIATDLNAVYDKTSKTVQIEVELESGVFLTTLLDHLFLLQQG
jgi:tRNA pseudouridine13 synthase